MPTLDQATRKPENDRYGELPLYFEVNQGQLASNVEFATRGSGFALFLTRKEAILSFSQPSGKRPVVTQSSVSVRSGFPRVKASKQVAIRMKMLHSNDEPEAVAEEQLPGKVNYILGDSPSRWVTDVPTYARVRYRNIYPGIDLVYYGNQGQLEYDLIVAPGADPSKIQIRFEGSDHIALSQGGDLQLTVDGGNLTLRKPLIYQLGDDGQRRKISGRFRIKNRRDIGLEVSAFDVKRSLVIDPTLSFSSYLGGSANDSGNGIAVDSSGNSYITGTTSSLNFPTVGTQISPNDFFGNAFVTKLSPDGTTMVYSTFLGGSFRDAGFAVTVDATGNAYVAGQTNSRDFPVVFPIKGRGGFFKSTNGGDLWSNRNTGINTSVRSLAVDSNNPATIYAGAFPGVYKSTNAGQSWSQISNGLPNAEIKRLAVDSGSSSTIYAATDGSGIYKSTNAGSSWGPVNTGLNGLGIYAMTIDRGVPTTLYAGTIGGGLYKTTNGGSSWSPINNGLPNSSFSINDILIDPVTSTTLYVGTYAQGAFKSTDSGDHWMPINSGLTNSVVFTLAVDPTNPSIVYAGTPEGVFKSTTGGASWISQSVGLNDHSVTALVIDPTTPSILYASGANNGGIYRSINSGNSWNSINTGLITNNTLVRTLILDPIVSSTIYAGSDDSSDDDLFIAKLNASGNGLLYSALLGGSNYDNSFGIAVDAAGSAYVCGETASGDFITTPGAFQVTGAGNNNAFVAKLNSLGSDLIYSTYLGGSDLDSGSDIAVDSFGNAYVAGITSSLDFPVSNAVQPFYGGVPRDAFVTKLSSSGGSLIYSTYLGGSGSDSALGIAIDTTNNAFVTGETLSVNFPTKGPVQPLLGGSGDAFITKLSATGNALIYSTYLGGSNSDRGRAIAVDSTGKAHVVGETFSANFPTNNPIQSLLGGSNDVFVAELDAAGTGLVYSTYLGGSGADQGKAIAVDGSEGTFITGSTTSTNFPTANPFQSVNAGSTDAFVCRVPVANVIQFSVSTSNVNEGAGSLNVTVTRVGDSTGAATADYKTMDSDTFTVGCADVAHGGGAFGRCDYSTSVDTLNFAPGETSKTFAIPIIDDSWAEGNETFSIVLSNVTGVGLGSPATATITIIDNETVNGPNPIFSTPFFVREHYLDFLSREPEVGEPWTAVLNNCSDVNNNPLCDRLTVSAAFFGSPEFQLKGYFVYRFYKLAFNRLPTYPEIVTDMRAVTGQTPAEVFQKKAAFSSAFVQRAEFTAAYPGTMTPADYVSALMGRYSLTQITTPDPAAPDGTNKVTLTTAQLQSQLSGGTLTRAQVLRAIADSDQVLSLEFNQAFVAMQYYGYLRRTPEIAGYNAWLAYLTAHPTDSRTMVNGFMNSVEYRLRFGPQ